MSKPRGKRGKLKTGDRQNIVDYMFWSNYNKAHKDTPLEVDRTTFNKIIQESNSLIATRVADNPEGFKLPENMGYLAISRYKAKKRAIDFNKTLQLGITCYHTNFHSYGYTGRIMWFSADLTRCKFHQIYKFVGDTNFKKNVSRNLFSGRVYNEYNYSHFKAKKIRLDLDKKLKLK